MCLFGLDLLGWGLSVFRLCVCGSPYKLCFMIYVPVYVSVMGRHAILRACIEKEKREALCSPFLFGWLMGARSFVFNKYNDRKLLFSSLSHTLVLFLVFQLVVFCFAQNASLNFLRIGIFSFLSFFVIRCWTSHRVLCSAVVGIHLKDGKYLILTSVSGDPVTSVRTRQIMVYVVLTSHVTNLLSNILVFILYFGIVSHNLCY